MGTKPHRPNGASASRGDRPERFPDHRPHDDLLPRRRPERSLTKRVVFLVAGGVLILTGVVLTILPVVPGWPLTIVGILVLSMADHRVRRLINRGDRKLPARMQHGLRWARDKSGMHERMMEKRRRRGRDDGDVTGTTGRGGAA